MKKVLIHSDVLLSRQKKLEFYEIVPMTPQDLPDYIKKSILMRHSYGGGY